MGATWGALFGRKETAYGRNIKRIVSLKRQALEARELAAQEQEISGLLELIDAATAGAVDAGIIGADDARHVSAIVKAEPAAFLDTSAGAVPKAPNNRPDAPPRMHHMPPSYEPNSPLNAAPTPGVRVSPGAASEAAPWDGGEAPRQLRLGGRPPEVAAPLWRPWPPSQDHGAAVWAAAPLQDRHDFGDLHVPPPPAPPLPPGSPLSRATYISSSASPAVADCSMSLDEFGRQVEALDANHEFSHVDIAQLHDLISRTRPSKPQNQVVALVLANTRGGSCFLDADKGVGLIVGLPAHLAPLVLHSPSLGRFVIGMARFQAAHTHNFCYCVN
ncbi:hypothetical protein M885DRAFT_620527, partial [Pelagophyceae sp. CCMP2097]